MKIINKRILVFVFFVAFNFVAKAQTFNCFITNDTLLNPNVYQFDIYLEATSGSFYFKNIQVGIQFDSAFFAAGTTITGSVVPGSTQLNSYGGVGIQFNSIHKCLSVSANTAGVCWGSPQTVSNATYFAAGTGPLRIASYQLTSTLPFNNVPPRPSMLLPTQPAPGSGILRMAITHWGPTCITFTISNLGVYTNFAANTLIDQIHDFTLYVPVLPNVTGEVFNDINSNCQRDSFESALSQINILCNPPGVFTQTDISGNFNFVLQDGQYQLQCGIPTYWTLTCANNNVNVVNGIASNNVSFGLTAVPGIIDLSVNFAHPPVRNNRDVLFTIQYRNLGTVTMDGTIRFNINSIFTFINSVIPPDSIQPNSLSWNFTNLLPGEDRLINFTLHTGVNPISTLFSNTAFVWGTGNDVNLSDNSFTIIDSLRGEVDPNEKNVLPRGIGWDGFISPDDSILYYRIAFQNAGTDTAFSVKVVDILDPDLDPLTLSIGAVSSPCTYSLSSAGTLTFIFDNINLPDSTTDEANSHGFVNFFIETKPNLSHGTFIQNTAFIYFNNELPLSTNTVNNTIDYALSSHDLKASHGSLKVFPNPFERGITVSLFEENGNEKRVIVNDVFGRVVLETKQISNEFILDLNKISNGIYFISVYNNKLIGKAKVIKQ